MAEPTLRFRDGFADHSPALRDEVRHLQRALQRAGHTVGTDGLFGRDTEEAVKAFQRAHHLEDDGVVGPNTWRALAGNVPAAARSSAAEPEEEVLRGFRGDLSWVHAREGHAGKAYWPGGASGVTLDPGVDLGHAQLALIEVYKQILTPEQYAAVQHVMGVRDEAAKAALAASSMLQSIRISRTQADTIFPYAAQPYWEAIVKRFPTLIEADTLPAVHTVMLSLAYNRGARNRALGELQQPLERKAWAALADAVGAMQQNHRLVGIRKRRQMEAELIRAALEQ